MFFDDFLAARQSAIDKKYRIRSIW